jgi:hypothetical protein
MQEIVSGYAADTDCRRVTILTAADGTLGCVIVDERSDNVVRWDFGGRSRLCEGLKSRSRSRRHRFESQRCIKFPLAKDQPKLGGPGFA